MELVSKSRFKPRALEFMRRVEKTGEPLIITDHGTPTLELRPFRPDHIKEDPMVYLRKAIIDYIDPMVPVDEDEWESKG